VFVEIAASRGVAYGLVSTGGNGGQVYKLETSDNKWHAMGTITALSMSVTNCESGAGVGCDGSVFASDANGCVYVHAP
jgi:hypothetical protein